LTPSELTLTSKQPRAKRDPIRDLRTHSEPYVTVGELAKYWSVSRKQIYKQIDAGTLHAIKLGPRLLRIATPEALHFERRANMHPPARQVGAAALVRSVGIAEQVVRRHRLSEE
jgi:excisionase family DNA binding protein